MVRVCVLFNNSLRNIFDKFLIDRAVFFLLLSKAWGIVAAPVTAIFIATLFSPDLQGYYYTFSSLLALQVFIELGLGTVITQFASHEWSKLELSSGTIKGDSNALSRLSSLTRLAIKWYFFGGIILIFILIFGGKIFFRNSVPEGIEWARPWVSLSILTGINIFFFPVWFILEGCNQVKKLYLFRFIQGLTGSLILWLAIMVDMKLWSASAMILSNILAGVIFLSFSYRKFLAQLLKVSSGSVFNWRRDIFPMQWKIAISWVSGFFIFSIFTPVAFKFYGPKVAGQMGMTWSIVTAIGTISSSWLAPRVPYFGILIAKKDYANLDLMFWKITKIMAFISILISCIFWLSVYFLNLFGFSLSNRVLSPLPTAIFLISQLLLSLTFPVSAYLRAHKKEPLLLISVFAAVSNIFFIFLLGKLYYITGIALAYLLTNAIFLPVIYWKWVCLRKEWHILHLNLS